MNIDQHLLAEAKLIAARNHRTIGSVLEDALRKLLDDQSAPPTEAPYELPRFSYDPPGLRPGVDLYDKEQTEALMDDGTLHVLP